MGMAVCWQGALSERALALFGSLPAVNRVLR